MERRRLAVISSHICSPVRWPMPSAVPPVLSTSVCHAGGGGGGGLGRTQEGTEKERCVFCLIVLGESPAFKLYEDDVCLCILDSNPLCSGHSLIIPKLHFPSLQDTPRSVVAAMCSTVPFLTNAIMKATQCGRLRSEYTVKNYLIALIWHFWLFSFCIFTFSLGLGDILRYLLNAIPTPTDGS